MKKDWWVGKYKRFMSMLRTKYVWCINLKKLFFEFRWLPGVINVFADKNNFNSVRSDKLDSFYSSVTILISNQVCIS